MARIMPQKPTAKSAVSRMSDSEESKSATDIMDMQFFDKAEDAVHWMET